MNAYLTALAELQTACSPTIQPGLERIEALLAELGHPERALHSRAIHVAGTNGKGSVCAMLDAILLAQGFSTGRFTSPHLHDYRERCLLNGRMMSEEQVAALLKRVTAAIEKLTAKGGPRPTEFEAAAAWALLALAEAKPDWVILEVGLGGRYDATNVVNASLAVITNIGRDHMEYLGDTIAEIAREKAGIIKPGARVFTAAEGEALDIITAEAEAQHATLHILGKDIPAVDYPLSLLGAHQRENAALAVAVAQAAGTGESAIRTGLLQATHPARLEVISDDPLVVLDGAHNVPGMATLARALADYWPGKRCLALIGMLADKEREQALSLLIPHIAGAVITRPPVLPRSEGWAKLADICAAQGLAIPPGNIIEDIPAACARALELLPGYDMLLVCGSLYLVAEARAYLKAKKL